MPLLNRVESAFNPTVRGRYFGYVEPPVFRRIDELAELENGWHFGAGIPISTQVLAVAKITASHAVSVGLDKMDAFPSKNGDVTIAIYLGEQDHSFQIRRDLSFRYWIESDPASEVEERLSFGEVIKRVTKLSAPRSWNSYFSSIFAFGIVRSGTLEVRHSKIRVTEVESQSPNLAVYIGTAVPSVLTRVDSIQPSVQNHLSSGGSTNQRCQLIQEDSDSGDECHHNIQGIKDGKEKKFFKGVRSAGRLSLEICDGDSPRALRIPEDIDALLAQEQ